MPERLQEYGNILNELVKAVKMHNFYPDGHPNLGVALEKCYTLIKNHLDASGDISWKVDLKGFYLDKNRIAPGSQEITQLARKLAYRKVKGLNINGRLKPDELGVLFSILKEEPEAIAAKGGVETIFADNDVAGILLNEMRYEDIKKLKAELERKREEERKALEEAGEDEAEEEESEQEDEAAGTEADQSISPELAAAMAEEGPVEDEQLAALLERIRNETDFLKYNDLSVRIKEKADKLLREKAYLSLLPILRVFASHSSLDSPLPDDIRSIASDRLREMLAPGVIRYLVTRVSVKDEAQIADLREILLSGGERATEELLDALTESDTSTARRNIYNTLLYFGSSITPNVEKRLASSKWFVVRQMVALLGDIKEPLAIKPLTEAYGHPNIKVKKEVLKSLVKIPSGETARIIVEALDEEDTSLKCQAIISLGAIKHRPAIGALGAIVLKRETFSDNQDPCKEAIKALGMIGDPAGADFLKELLFRKVWFGKKSHEELRTLAAASLGMIGTEDAYKAIEKAGRSAEGPLYITCKRILESRGKSL